MKQNIKVSVLIAFILSLGILLIHAWNAISFGNPSMGGIYPRSTVMWTGIFTAPLVHADWEHLFSNLPPLFVCTIMIFYFYRTIAWPVMLLTWVLTGFAVWCFGRPVIHIGASGVVYALIGFVFFSGVFRRNLKSIVLTLIVTVMYSGYLIGLFPVKEGISWESHLFGAIAGAWTAFVFRNFREADEVKKRYDWQDEPNEKTEYFLDRDTFFRTKQERENDMRNLDN